MSAAYVRAAIPEPYRILGLKLKPFCLGHFMLMQRFDCAFAADETVNATREDLIFAVLICSKTYEEFLQFIEQEDFLEQVHNWGKEVGEFNFIEKLSLFKEYMEQGTEIPKYWEEKEGRSSGAHWTHAVKIVLTGELGYSESEALNAPLAKAFADYFKHAENTGAIQLMTPEEIAFIEAAEKAEQEAKCQL